MIVPRKTTVEDVLRRAARERVAVPAGPLGVTPPGSWNAPTFAESFTHYEAAGVFSAVAFRKDANNLVTLRGLVKKAGAVTAFTATMFTLPAGFRPAKQHLFTTTAVVDGGSEARVRVDIAANGRVIPGFGAASALDYCSLDGISFYTD